MPRSVCRRHGSSPSYRDHRLSRVLPETIAIPINAVASGIMSWPFLKPSWFRADEIIE
jgi:hypothetical protein